MSVGQACLEISSWLPDFRWPMKNCDFFACLAYIVYNWEVNSSDDNKRLVMEKKHGRCHDNGFGNKNKNNNFIVQ